MADPHITIALVAQIPGLDDALFRRFTRAVDELKDYHTRNPLLPRDFTLPHVADEDD